MGSWSVNEWLLFFGGVASLMGAIAGAAVTIIKALKGVEDAVCETKQAVVNHDVASAVRHTQTQHTLKGEIDAREE